MSGEEGAEEEEEEEDEEEKGSRRGGLLSDWQWKTTPDRDHRIPEMPVDSGSVPVDNIPLKSLNVLSHCCHCQTLLLLLLDKTYK